MSHSAQGRSVRPVIRRSGCLWLVIRCEKEGSINPGNSQLTITGPEEDSRGFELDGRRRAFKALSYILLPVCIDWDAAQGQWKVEMETIVHGEESTVQESITATIEIQ